MSIWADIHKKSNGIEITKEDFSEIYTGEDETTELYSGEYNNHKYIIYTTGKYPFIKIITELGISFFSGYQLVKLKIDNKTYDLERVVSGNTVGYIHFFNEKDDYVKGIQDGKKYDLTMLKQFAEKFIDMIISSEKRLGK